MVSRKFRSGLSIVCVLFLCTGLALGTNFLLTSPLLGDDSAPPIKSPPAFKLALLAKTADNPNIAPANAPPLDAIGRKIDNAKPPAYLGTFIGKVQHGSPGNMDGCHLTFDGNGPGRYHFADSLKKEQVSTGVIHVDEFDSKQRRIIGLWIDEYGQGPIVLTFNDDYSGYSGLWGEHYGKPPTNKINGRRL